MTTNNENLALLRRLTMSKLRCHNTASGGVAWSGVLLLDGAPHLRVSNDGNGGCNRYERADGAGSCRGLVDVLETAARALTGQRYEALDTLTACMDSGSNAADAVAVATEALNHDA